MFITWGGRTYNPTTHCTINFQCSNDPSYAHSQPPCYAPTCALKGQPPSAVGTALGNATHNKTRPNGAKAFYWFRLLPLGRIAFALFSPETCVSTQKLISFRVTLKCVAKCSIDWNKPPKGVNFSDFIRTFAILCFVSIENLFFFATLGQVIFWHDKILSNFLLFRILKKFINVVLRK